MGGDHAPEAVVEGALRAVRSEEGADCEVLLFGDEAVLAPLLDANSDGLPLRIIHAPETIGMAEAPAAAVRNKRHSSIHLGIGAVKAGQAQAFVSAGNTGAVMAASLFILGRLPGVARPAVIGYYPTVKGFSIILDVGTNVDCKPEHLVQFARMGTLYARTVLKRENPTVGLMNIGEEPGKGNEQVKAAYELLSQASDLAFIGNMEGREVLEHAADVIVCDGFVGNIMLKLGESVATALLRMIKREMQEQGVTEEQSVVLMRVLGAVMKKFDYEVYGGAPLLGVDGNVIIGHGGSSARAFERLILVGAEVARQNVSGNITSAVGY